MLNWVLQHITQYYMDTTVNITQFTCMLGSIQFKLLNITNNITQYYMSNHTILLNVAIILGNIQ